MTTLRFAGTVMVVALLPFPANGQYYENTPRQPSDRFLHAGFFAQTFEPRSSNVLPDSLRISYRRVMPAIGYRQGLVDITVGYTRFSLRGQGRTALYVGLSVGHELPIAHSGASALLVRLLVSSDYTRAENTGGEKESFIVGSAGIGAGMAYRLKQPGFEFSLVAAEAVHGSFETFSTGIGFSSVTTGEILVLLHNALLFDGIALGYRFRYQTWNMNNDAFDYRSFSHGAFVGVMF